MILNEGHTFRNFLQHKGISYMNKYTLMHRVLTGAATKIERNELRQWISSDPLNLGAFEEIRILYSSDDFTGPDEDDSNDLKKLLHDINQHKQAKNRTKHLSNIGISVIVSAMVFMVSIFLLNLNTTQRQSGSVASIVLSRDLQFNNATLGSILALLEDQYDLAFTIHTRDLLSCTFTGTFYHGVSMADLMGTLAQAENLNIVFIDGKKMEISGPGCQQ